MKLKITFDFHCLNPLCLFGHKWIWDSTYPNDTIYNCGRLLCRAWHG